MTTLAFLAFAQAKVEAVVLEVGLGGRTDATNVSQPLVSVITRISYDHMAVLGKTLTKIASEKAGIMRPHRPVVIAPQYPEALTTLKQIAAQKESLPTLIGDDVAWRVGQATFDSQQIWVAGHPYQLALLGDHQAANAATAVTAVRYFAQSAGLNLPQTAIEQGLATVNWPGRMEILSRDPLVMADSAMNGDSADRLSEALSHYFYGRNLLLIFGSSRDHDYTSMMHRLLPKARHTIVSRSQHPKATPPSTLSQVAKAIGYPVSTAPSIPAALAEALSIAAEDDIICITGSLFCAAEARLAWAKHAGLPLPPTDPI
jgi:dihydrofolate synthase/folylpolyglutamate synthase